MVSADGLPPPPPNPFNPPIWVNTSDQSCSLWMNEYKKTFTGALHWGRACGVDCRHPLCRTTSWVHVAHYCMHLLGCAFQCMAAALHAGGDEVCTPPLSSPLPAAITAGRRSPSYLVYSTAGADYPGGLAGRIKGITTVFILAVLLGKSTCWLQAFAVYL